MYLIHSLMFITKLIKHCSSFLKQLQHFYQCIVYIILVCSVHTEQKNNSSMYPINEQAMLGIFFSHGDSLFLRMVLAAEMKCSIYL